MRDKIPAREFCFDGSVVDFRPFLSGFVVTERWVLLIGVERFTRALTCGERVAGRHLFPETCFIVFAVAFGAVDVDLAFDANTAGAKMFLSGHRYTYWIFSEW